MAYNFKITHEQSDELALDQIASDNLYSGIVIPEQKPGQPLRPEVSLETKLSEEKIAKSKELPGTASKQKVWESLTKDKASSQNYTPNVWESPDVNICEPMGEYEAALLREKTIDEAKSVDQSAVSKPNF